MLLLPSPSLGLELPWGNNGSPTKAGPVDPAQPSDDPAPDDSKEESCDRVAVVVSYLDDQGFAKRDYVIGTDRIDWKLSPSRADYPFSKPIESQEALQGFLGSNHSAARAAREVTGGTAASYVPVQFKNAVSYTGNWYWKQGRAVKGGDRMVLAGDVWWLAQDSCKVAAGKSIRAVCGNVGFDQLSLVASRRS